MADIVGKFTIHNGGGFVCRGKAKYEDGDNDVTTDQETGDILLGQTQEYDPGDLGVPDGARMTIYVDVVAGSDNAGRHHFTYQKGNPHKGDYVITGTTLDNFLGLIGIS